MPAIRRLVSLTLMVLAPASAMVACGDGTEPTAPDSPNTAVPEPSATPSVTLGDILTAFEDRRQREQRVLADAGALEPLLNDFWSNELPRASGMRFDPPDRFEYYRGASGNSPCAGQAIPKPNNAYYCDRPEDDEYVAFDLDWFQDFLILHPGDATTFLILAHEWGHAVQDSWLEQGGNDTWDPPYRKELNADCLAGVFLAASIKNGAIVEEAGDADAIFSWLYQGGSAPWLTPGDHGSSEQRQAAFSDGYANGTKLCREQY
jgi:uncharacterized protein